MNKRCKVIIILESSVLFLLVCLMGVHCFFDYLINNNDFYEVTLSGCEQSDITYYLKYQE